MFSKTLSRLFVAVATVVLTSSAFAEVETLQIDPAHSAAQFSVRHMGISTVRGSFSKLSGTVKYDPSDASKTSIDATIDATTVDTRVEMRDNDLRGPNFFDTAKYPTITFKSKKTESAGAGMLKVTGDLTMHGVTKEVVLDVEGPSDLAKGPRGDQRRGASVSTKINRKDFGVNGAAMMVADEISITIDVETVKQ